MATNISGRRRRVKFDCNLWEAEGSTSDDSLNLIFPDLSTQLSKDRIDPPPSLIFQMKRNIVGPA
jgi:hypothetical protein